jgi:hypothetical protein
MNNDINYKLINFNSENHLDCIWCLSKINNFYIPDFFAFIFGKLFVTEYMLTNFSKEDLIKFREIGNIECQKISDNFKKNNKGIFICKGKKPIGFLIYNFSNIGIFDFNTNIISLKFIMIHKKHQCEGYGTNLLNFFHSKIRNDNSSIIISEIDKNNNNTDNIIKWWMKQRYKYPNKGIKYGTSNIDDKINKIDLIFTLDAHKKKKENRILRLYFTD